jgi:hypothetical protein
MERWLYNILRFLLISHWSFVISCICDLLVAGFFHSHGTCHLNPSVSFATTSFGTELPFGGCIFKVRFNFPDSFVHVSSCWNQILEVYHRRGQHHHHQSSRGRSIYNSRFLVPWHRRPRSFLCTCASLDHSTWLFYWAGGGFHLRSVVDGSWRCNQRVLFYRGRSLSLLRSFERR